MRLTRLGKLILILLALCGTLSGAVVTAARQGQEMSRCFTLAPLGSRRAVTIDTASGHAALDSRRLEAPYISFDLRSYSPDGWYRTEPVYSSQPTASFVLYKGERQALVLHDDLYAVFPGVWSSDSRHFAFKVYAQGQYLLKVVNVATRQIAMVELENRRSSTLGEARLVWAPDGRSLSITYLLYDEDRIVVYRYDTERAQFRTDSLRTEGGAFQAVWAPDGAHLGVAVTVSPQFSQVFILNRDGVAQQFAIPRAVQLYLDDNGRPYLLWWLNAQRLILSTTDQRTKVFDVFGEDGFRASFPHAPQQVERWYENIDGGRRVLLMASTGSARAGGGRGTLIELDTETGASRLLLDSLRLFESRQANRARPYRGGDSRNALLFVQETANEQAIVMTDRAGRILYRMPITSLPRDWYIWSDDATKVLIAAPGPEGLQRVVLRTDGTVLHAAVVQGAMVNSETRWLNDDQRLVFNSFAEGQSYIDLIDTATGAAQRLITASDRPSRLLGEGTGALHFVVPDAQADVFKHTLVDGTLVALPGLERVSGPWIAPDGHAALILKYDQYQISLRNTTGEQLVWDYPEIITQSTWTPDSREFVLVSGRSVGVAQWARFYRADGTLIRQIRISGELPVHGSRWSDCSTHLD